MPSPSSIDKAVTRYQELMRVREADVMRNLMTEWINIENNLQAEMSELAYIMDAKRDAGEVITQQMLWKEEKYRRLIQQAEDQISKFTKTAEGLINTSQLDAYVLGVDAANDLVEMQYKSIGALSPFWEKTDIKGVESMSAVLRQGKPLYNLLEASYPTAVQGLSSALIEGVARGFLPGQVAENMVKNFGLGADRALLIAQTEMSRAYREGTIQQYRSTPVVEYYIRMANKATACLACIILDGTKYNKSDEMSDHPRGMCNILAKVKGVPPPQWEHGEKWFKTLDEADQRRIMGGPRFELWKSGQVKFKQFATMTHNKTWGEAPAVLSLRALQQRYGVTIPTRVNSGGALNLSDVSSFDQLMNKFERAISTETFSRSLFEGGKTYNNMFRVLLDGRAIYFDANSKQGAAMIAMYQEQFRRNNGARIYGKMFGKLDEIIITSDSMAQGSFTVGAQAGARKIIVHKNGSAFGYEELIHELGHQAPDYMTFKIAFQEFIRHGELSPSGYGLNDISEDIAESVRMYFMDPNKLKYDHNMRYQFIRSWLNE